MKTRMLGLLLLATATLAACGESEDQIRTEERVKILEEQLAEVKKGPSSATREPAASRSRVRSVQAQAESDTSPSLIGSYEAFIGEDDLVNSAGARLSNAAAIIRQDRANFHRFGVRQQGDTDDEFFASAANRAAMERMVAGGSISADARRLIVNGGATVRVDIYGQGGVGDFINISVS